MEHGTIDEWMGMRPMVRPDISSVISLADFASSKIASHFDDGSGVKLFALNCRITIPRVNHDEDLMYLRPMSLGGGKESFLGDKKR